MIDLTKIKYKKRYNKDIIIFVSPILLLDRLEKDDTNYNVRNPKNQIGNRVERAKEFILKNWNNSRATFEPSIVGIYNDKLSFTDGRHRVLAASELNIPEIAIEIPKNQEHLFDYMKVKKITESPDHVYPRQNLLNSLKWEDESAKYSDNNIQKRQMNYTSESMNINETPSYETEVRIMAWLYIIFCYDQIGIEEKKWVNDNRMNITFKESIEPLEKQNYIKSNNDGIWKITNDGKKALYDFFKPPKTREEFLNYNSNWLKKYDVSGFQGYIISKIPIELYEKKFQEDSENKMSYTLTIDEYSKLATWFLKYQRGLIGWWTRLNQYLGLKNELIPDVNEMVLYRGLNFNLNYDNIGLLPNNMCVTSRGTISITDLKKGDKILCNKSSWTLNKNIAKIFASGKKGYHDYKKMSNNEIGIILKNTFSSSDILLDVDWIENNKYLQSEVVFSEEMEVIIKPKKRYVEVVEIFNSTDIYEKKIITKFKDFENIY
jgi:hypothetical protein